MFLLLQCLYTNFQQPAGLLAFGCSNKVAAPVFCQPEAISSIARSTFVILT
jgi:hypothetical protein